MRYKVLGPDGKEHIIEGPENATPEEIESAAAQIIPAKPKGPSQTTIDNDIANLIRGIRKPSLSSQLKRQLGLTGRAIAEGVADIAAIPANALAGASNVMLGTNFPYQEQAVSNLLTSAGMPEPQTTGELISNIGGRFATGMAAGGPINRAISGLAPAAPASFIPTRATTQAGKILERHQIPIERAQATGSPSLNRLRSALMDNPVTTGKQQAFTETQQKAFNSAVLKSIGEKSDEATQQVMRSARDRIGGVFDKVGSKGATFDDMLQNNISDIVDEARSTVPESALRPLLKNIDDLLTSVDDAGKINGEILIKLRSRLSKLSKNPEVGQSARQLHDALINALERSNPGDKAKLANAVDQWRSLRIIEGAIGKGLDKDISPLRLSNALATKAQRSASIYGMGGDQGLIELAQAGRSLIPEALPQSGTIPRGLLQAPIRSILTSLPLLPAQRYLLSQPNIYAAQPGLMTQAILPTTGILGDLMTEER